LIDQVQFSDFSWVVAMATKFVSYAKHKRGAIFAIFITYECFLGVDDTSEIFFNNSRDIDMATNFV